MDMISIDDLKPGKLLVGRNSTGERWVFQIISPLLELKTSFNVDVIRGSNYYFKSKYRYFLEQDTYLTKEELLKNNNYIPYWRKPRINEIFDWYILQFENEMYAQEQNP